MAQSEDLTCPICLELLKNPVTIPCGHSFCKDCIKNCWPPERDRYQCPQCRKRHRTKSGLNKNVILADLVEQLKKTPADHCAGPQDVACDVCPEEKKLKAHRSCLQCMVSYCEVHLQPHHNVAVLQTHQLVAPSHKLQENICKEHNKVMELFCRTDQQLLCCLCSVEQHKGHDTVSSAAERAQRQAEQEAKKDLLLQILQDKDTDLQSLQQEAQDIRSSAQRAVQRSVDMFREIALLLERRRSEVEQLILSEEKTQLSRVQELQDQLQQEVTEVRRSLSELEELSNNPDHNQFILHCLSLSTERTERTGTRVLTGDRCNFEKIPRFVIALTEKLQLVLNRFKSAGSEEASSSVPPSMPASRQDFFLHFGQLIEMDTKTANTQLYLSNRNRTVKFVRESVKYQDHPERFTYWGQVMSKRGMIGRSYWEVDASKAKRVSVAVAYKDIKREGNATRLGTVRIAISYKKSFKRGIFGTNKGSWCLETDRKTYSFWFNNMKFSVSGPRSSRIGVYLDQFAGSLSFYSVSDNTMTLLHRVQTTFTWPVFAGIGASIIPGAKLRV
uniref:Tripartite motif-containing protein 16-like n=1 Tax=Periophthalmus magnuspinnatus TaxID=409849 RepID=A0A3B4ARN9_9GOBI